MDVVNALNSLPLIHSRSELIAHVNASDHKHVALEFNFSDGFRTKPVIAGVDLARLQRAAECAGESTGGRGNDIIQGCGMRRISLRGDPIMFSDLGMDAEDNRFFLRRQVGKSHRTGFSFDAHSRRINNLIRFTHINPTRLISC